MGRALDNAMLNIGQKDVAKSGLAELGFRIEDVIEKEHDAALGNGGLGRLAACFLDSLASLDYPAWGYGLRYRYGIFKQEIIDGYQVEVPDYWLGAQKLLDSTLTPSRRNLSHLCGLCLKEVVALLALRQAMATL